jgi:hypothetical protein
MSARLGGSLCLVLVNAMVDSRATGVFQQANCAQVIHRLSQGHQSSDWAAVLEARSRTHQKLARAAIRGWAIRTCWWRAFSVLRITKKMEGVRVSQAYLTEGLLCVDNQRQ